MALGVEASDITRKTVLNRMSVRVFMHVPNSRLFLDLLLLLVNKHIP